MPAEARIQVRFRLGSENLDPVCTGMTEIDVDVGRQFATYRLEPRIVQFSQTMIVIAGGR
jgi:hypothetical protein